MLKIQKDSPSGQQQSKMKEMMICAHDKRGVIATDRIPKGTSITGAYYKNFLQNVLRPKIRKLRAGMLHSDVLILHDNARRHISAPIIELLEKYGWERLRQPGLQSWSEPSWRNLFGGCIFRRWKSSEEKWPDRFGCSIRTGRWTESKHFRATGKSALIREGIILKACNCLYLLQ